MFHYKLPFPPIVFQKWFCIRLFWLVELWCNLYRIISLGLLIQVLCLNFFRYILVTSWIKPLHWNQVLCTIVVSRVFNKRKGFRAFSQPASVPRKRPFPGKSIVEFSPYNVSFPTEKSQWSVFLIWSWILVKKRLVRNVKLARLVSFVI